MSILKISFIIPVYNGSNYIRSSIASIQKNNFIEGDEIIVVDDHSSDNSVEILQELFNKGQITQFYQSSSNQGEGITKNIAITMSKNKHFFCLDQDNLLENNSISSLRSNLDDYDAIGFGGIKYFQFNKVLTSHEEIYKYKYLDLEIFKKSFKNLGWSGNLLYTKNVWEKVGGFENVILESWNFMYKVLQQGGKVKVLQNSYYFHRYGHASAYTRAVRLKSLPRLILDATPKKNLLDIKSYDLFNYKVIIKKYYLNIVFLNFIRTFDFILNRLTYRSKNRQKKFLN